MSGDTRALRQTTGSPQETGGCEPGRYKLLPEPVAEAPAILRAGRCLSDPTGHRPRFDDETKFVCRSVAGKRSPRRRQPKSSAVTIRWYRTSAYHTFQAITSFDTPRFPPAVFESDRRFPQPRITHPDGPLPTDIKKIIRKTRPPRHIRICRGALSNRHLASAIIGTAAAVRGPQAGEPPDESAIPAGQEKLPRRQSTPSPSLRSQTENKKTEGTRNKGRPPGNYKIIICWVRDDFILSNIPYFR